jgi:hypothetical protein
MPARPAIQVAGADAFRHDANGIQAASLDHLVGAREQRLRDRKAERLCGFEVDHQFDLGRLFDRQVCGVSPFEIFST